MSFTKKFFFVTCLLSFYVASACNCGHNPSKTWKEKTTREFYYASSIFLGKVIDITLIEEDVPNYEKAADSPVKYTFQVEEMIKGRTTTKEIVIYSSWSSGTCGYFFEKGKTYLVHAKKTVQYSKFTDQQWSNVTMQCIGNTIRRRTEKKRLDLLRKLAKS